MPLTEVIARLREMSKYIDSCWNPALKMNLYDCEENSFEGSGEAIQAALAILEKLEKTGAPLATDGL